MKKKLFYIIFCVTSFVSFANAQDLRGNNLAGYKQLNYYINQEEESTCMLCQSSFTKPLVQEKLHNSFSINNIPATLITTFTYPFLSITIYEPNDATASASCGYQTLSITAHEYMVAFDLIDIINGKKVLVYQLTRRINSVNSDKALEAMGYWKALNTCLDEFLADWKSTH